MDGARDSLSRMTLDPGSGQMWLLDSLRRTQTLARHLQQTETGDPAQLDAGLS